MNAEHILVVEDSKLVMRLLTSRLESQGYQVTGAATVSEAMAAVRNQAPDLLVLDLTLYDADPFAGLTDGLAFLSLCRRINAHSDFPVIIHSVDNSPETKVRASALGVSAVIHKGSPPEELLTAIRKALDERQCQQASRPSPEVKGGGTSPGPTRLTMEGPEVGGGGLGGGEAGG